MSEEYKIEYRKTTVKEYQVLRNSTDWGKLEDAVVSEGIKNSLFSVCILSDDNVVAMGRVVGDGAIYFYIQDVIVLPEHQGKGIGRQIIKEIDNYLNSCATENAFIGLMAAKGVSKFYESFGYKIRPSDGPGMFRVIKRT